MGTMLGIGWNRKCEHCGTTFRAFSLDILPRLKSGEDVKDL